MKSSQSNFNLWSPSSYLVRSYLITTVLLRLVSFSAEQRLHHSPLTIIAKKTQLKLPKIFNSTFAPNNFPNDSQTSMPKKQRKHVLWCITSVLISAAASTALPQRIADEILDWSVSCKRSSHTSTLVLSLGDGVLHHQYYNNTV